MTIDWTLRFSDIVSIGAFFFGGFGAILIMKSDLRALALKFGFLEETVKRETEAQNKKIDKQSEEIGKLGEVLTLMGRFEERMSRLRSDMDDMKHGRGFIIAPPIKEGS